MIVVPALRLPVIRQQERKALFGEFLTNAQGEDVVAGVRTPMKIYEMEEIIPEGICTEFKNVCKTLENHYRDMQDMEFTVETRQALHAADEKW